jgi:hypothetical protein
VVSFVAHAGQQIAMGAKVIMLMNMCRIADSERAQKKETFLSFVLVKTILAKN